MKLWRNEPEPVGATVDWSPIAEIGEHPRVQRIAIEHGLDLFDDGDRAYAVHLVEMRDRISGSMTAWWPGLEARLDEWAPGWRDDMPTIEWEREPVLAG